MVTDRYILDEHGNPQPCHDLMKWATWFETAADAKRVALDEIGGVRVSTVFLGVDHNWGEGPPLIYETMIFGGPHDDYQERYSTREEALAGHANAVALVRSAAPQLRRSAGDAPGEETRDGAGASPTEERR
jgi:hypothetical protein